MYEIGLDFYDFTRIFVVHEDKETSEMYKAARLQDFICFRNTQFLTKHCTASL